MAQLGFTEMTVLNPDGSPAPGVTLTIRKQGAQIRGNMAGTPYTVDDVGSIPTGSTVALWLRASKTETSGATATISSATSIATAPTLGGCFDDDRLTVTSPAPAIFEDANGGTAIGAVLTTDLEGRATFYAEAGFYDVKRTGGGLQPQLYTDVPCEGPKSTVYLFDAGSAVGYVDNIKNAATGTTLASAGAKIRSFRHNDVEKASVDKDGDIDCVDIRSATVTTTGAIVSGTSVNVGTTLGVTGASTLAAVTASGLITGSSGLTISGGTVSLPAGEIGTAELASNAVTVSNTASQSGTLGLTTTPTTITGLSVGLTVTSTSSQVLIMGQSCFQNTGGAANRLVTIGIYDGAALLTSTDAHVGFSPAASILTIPVFHVQTGVSGAKTYTIKASQSVGTDVNSLTGSGRIFAIEIKK